MAMSVLRLCLSLVVFFAIAFMITWFDFRYKFPVQIKRILAISAGILAFLLGLCSHPVVSPYAIISLISLLFWFILAGIIDLEVDKVTHLVRSKTEQTVFLIVWAILFIVFIISTICCAVTWMNVHVTQQL